MPLGRVAWVIYKDVCIFYYKLLQLRYLQVEVQITCKVTCILYTLNYWLCTNVKVKVFEFYFQILKGVCNLFAQTSMGGEMILPNSNINLETVFDSNIQCSIEVICYS